MGYRKIPNLYSDDRIIQICRKGYALEKLHGTSANVRWENGKVHLFSGGEKHDKFAGLFDLNDLAERFLAIGHEDSCPIAVYGEAYCGKCQGMKDTYGVSFSYNFM